MVAWRPPVERLRTSATEGSMKRYSAKRRRVYMVNLGGVGWLLLGVLLSGVLLTLAYRALIGP